MAMERFPKKTFLLVVGLQLCVLGAMIAKRVYLLKTGERVLLKCTPVDPRSLFSGDYVILNYEISTLPRDFLTDENGVRVLRNNDTIYVALKRDKGEKFYSAKEVSRDLKRLRQRYRVVIRGRISNVWRARVRYGVEHYFVPQNQGRAIEEKLEQVSVEVAVAESGESGIRRLFIDDKEVSFY